MNRRSLLTSALFATAAWRLPLDGSEGVAWAQGQPQPASPAPPQAKNWRHGTSLFGDLKYKTDFKQFDYVNAAAPKTGTVRQVAYGTFDNFNPVVAGVKGALAAGLNLIADTLGVPALDEISS